MLDNSLEVNVSLKLDFENFRLKNRMIFEENIGFDLLSLVDKEGNNIFHITAFQGDHEAIASILQKYNKDPRIGELINQRNFEGTNPLGMAFLNLDNNIKNINWLVSFFEVTKLVVKEKSFNVNAYLNNKKGMDYKSDDRLKEIGGFNCLHMAIKKGFIELLNYLEERDKSILEGQIDQADQLVNFSFPTLNPDYHMTSPLMLLDLIWKVESISNNLKTKINNLKIREELSELKNIENNLKNFKFLDSLSLKQKIEAEISSLLDALNKALSSLIAKNEDLVKIERLKIKSTSLTEIKEELNSLELRLEEKLMKLKNNQDAREDGYESGDSDDNNSPASKYKCALLGLQEKIDISEKIKNSSKIDNSDNKIESSFTSLNSENCIHEIVIPHFHGVPFMRGHYTNKQRRDVAARILSLNQQDQWLKALHSRTSTTTAGIESHYILSNQSLEHDSKLDGIDEKLRNYLSKCWAKDENSFLSAVRMYVYDFEENPIKEFWDLLAKIIVPPEDIIKYRFPFISTSKAPDHPVKFAFGRNVETTQRGELPFEPKYDATVKPKHRLAGFVYITFHSLPEMKELEQNKKVVDMVKLLVNGTIKTKKGGRIDEQIESTFLGGIDAKKIVAVVPIIYPNLSKNFLAGYHDKIWGLVDNVPGKNARKLISLKKKLKDKKVINLYKNDKKFTPEGRILMHGYVSFLLALAKSLALSQSKKLYYLSPEGKEVLYPMGYTFEDYPLTDAQREIAKFLKQKKKILVKNDSTMKDIPGINSQEKMESQKNQDIEKNESSNKEIKNFRFTKEIIEGFGAIICEAGGAGNCLFLSISQGLLLKNCTISHEELRKLSVKSIEANYDLLKKNFYFNDDFYCDTIRTVYGFMKCEDLNTYLTMISLDGSWGGRTEIAALAVYLKRPIFLFGGEGAQDEKCNIYNPDFTFKYKPENNYLILYYVGNNHYQHVQPLTGKSEKEIIEAALLRLETISQTSPEIIALVSKIKEFSEDEISTLITAITSFFDEEVSSHLQRIKVCFSQWVTSNDKAYEILDEIFYIDKNEDRKNSSILKQFTIQEAGLFHNQVKLKKGHKVFDEILKELPKKELTITTYHENVKNSEYNIPQVTPNSSLLFSARSQENHKESPKNYQPRPSSISWKF